MTSRRTSRSKPAPPPAARCAERLERRVLFAAALLRDLNPTTLGSSPQDFTDVNGTLYFSADGPAGRELYRSDGTAAGTSLVKDISPGAAGSAPQELFGLGDTLYFSADDGVHGRELWKSDGTEAGTALVNDPWSGAANRGSAPHGFVNLRGTLYYFAAMTSTQPQRPADALWRSDGTEAGTIPLAQVPRGSGGLTADGLRLTFVSPTIPTLGQKGELWVSNGTAAGTKFVKQVGAADPAVSKPASVNGIYYFAAADLGSVTHLWRSDGSAGGTFNHVGAGNNPHDFTAAGNRMFFAADRSTNNVELYVVDNPTTEARLVKDVLPTGSGNPRELTDVGGKLYFIANATTGTALWRTDGTDAGTVPVAFNLPAAPQHIVRSGDALYATTGGTPGSVHGLWRVDAAGTAPSPTATLVREFDQGGELTDPAPFRSGGVAFGALDPLLGVEPWTSDGTAAGTARVRDVNTRTAGSLSVNGLRAPVELGGRAYFPATTGPGADGAAANGLWSTDGTRDGTTLVKELPAPITALKRVGNSLIFLTGPSPSGVWRSDGTPGGTVQVAEVLNRPSASRDYLDTTQSAVMNEVLYFVGDSPSDPHGYDLYRTDGTPQGTYRVKDITPDADVGVPEELTVVGDTLYFAMLGGLWKTDGTESGTVKVLRPDLTQAAGSNLAAWQGELYFRVSNNPSDEELWKTDGTPGGTALVDRLDTAGGGVAPLVALNDRLVFAAIAVPGAGYDFGTELWASDGTPDGTHAIADIYEGFQSSSPADFLSAGPVAYFAANSKSEGRELWQTDGTEQGTFRLTDLNRGTASSSPKPLALIDGRLYFSAADGVHGRELWSIDVASAGPGVPPPAPVLVQDVNPGAADSSPAGVVPSGERIVFWADDGYHGVEPWVSPPPPAEVIGRHVFYNRSAFDQNNAAATEGDDDAVATDKQALLPGGTAGFANVTSYSRGLNGVMIDLRGLPAGAALSAADFLFKAGNGVDPGAWSDAPAPASVAVRPGAGKGGSDRVTLTWADGAIVNRWLRVTTLANPNTGLAAPDVFYFGNLVGETGDQPSGAPGITPRDFLVARRDLGRRSTTITSRSDFDRDGDVDALDLLAIRRNPGARLSSLGGTNTAVPGAAGVGIFLIAPVAAVANDLAPARVWDEQPTDLL